MVWYRINVDVERKQGAGDSLFARLNNITTIPTLMKILLQFHFGYSMV